ncbi:MAG TPA: glycine/sarcosine/betaine reductase selenoprotein B family protein [Gemmatirosa sp.]|nr:glycine/sarcosine/betaine reductase selenoprotein B family protein [Gemmatirosa sp.]
MATFDELPLRYRLALAIYPWRRIDPVPWTPLAGPLAAARVALVSSAGLYRPGEDAPFAHVRGGDTSWRAIPDAVPSAALGFGQTSDAFDRAPAEADRELVWPRAHLHALAASGTIGAVAPRHLSFNGSITAPARLVRQSAPEMAEVLRADMVDAALLVPV